LAATAAGTVLTHGVARYPRVESVDFHHLRRAGVLHTVLSQRAAHAAHTVHPPQGGRFVAPALPGFIRAGLKRVCSGGSGHSVGSDGAVQEAGASKRDAWMLPLLSPAMRLLRVFQERCRARTARR
jgi:hypothetical protein